MILCPYCLSIISENSVYCAVCGQDVTCDAPFETSYEELSELGQKPCQKCGRPIPTLANICRWCLVKQVESPVDRSV